MRLLIGVIHSCCKVRVSMLTRKYCFRDYSLITGRGGGGTKPERGVGGLGGHVKFYPYEIERGGGCRKSFSMLKGGTERFGVVFMS